MEGIIADGLKREFESNSGQIDKNNYLITLPSGIIAERLVISLISRLEESSKDSVSVVVCKSPNNKYFKHRELLTDNTDNLAPAKRKGNYLKKGWFSLTDQIFYNDIKDSVLPIASIKTIIVVGRTTLDKYDLLSSLINEILMKNNVILILNHRMLWS